MLKRIVLIYISGVVLIYFSSLHAIGINFPTYSLVLLVESLLLVYFIPQVLKLIFKGKTYNGEHAKKLLQFAHAHGVNIKSLLSVPSKSSNAYACGYGSNKIVVFHSKTFELHPFDELEGVMAHELGHYVNRDQILFIVLVDAVLILTTYINVVLLSAPNFSFWWNSTIEMALIFPIVLVILQWRERSADAFAKEMLDDPEKLIRFFERMIKDDEVRTGKRTSTNQNALSRLLRTHPTIHDRIKFLKS